ncbi:hypothetical protein GO491_04050 [Flavobacteriaceae bacterium Ap0902]|nr:hypothetical protein [Flavobacteriaceae bacterium Ap0902]
MFYRYTLLFLFLYTSTFSIAQKIEVTVIDEEYSAIPGATIQLLKDDSVVTYTITNAEGIATIKAENFGKYMLSVNFWGYEKKTIEINLSDASTIKKTIQLEKSAIELGEVVIQGRTKLARQKGDTLSYNLKALTDGNERKLKDIINKLPGAEVDERGKIRVNGKVVDDLLVNGQKLFGDNHKIATENMNADMLDEIDLIQNFEQFSAVKDIEGSNRTAMNLKIKEEYFGRITGDVDLFGGIKNRYGLHSNLFQFNKKFSLSAIADVNNTGAETMSVFDFIEMNSGIKSDIRNNNQAENVISSSSLPSFLLKRKDVAQKDNQFLSINTVYQPLPNWTITGYVIGNHSNIYEDKVSKKSFYQGNISMKDAQKTKMRNLNIQSKINSDYYFGEKALLNYTLNYSKNTTNQIDSIQNTIFSKTMFFEEKRNFDNYTFGQQLSYIQKISPVSLLSFNTYHELKETENPLKINANTPLFGAVDTFFSQEMNEHQNEYGLFAKYTRKINQRILTGSLGYNYLQQKMNIQNTSKTNDEIQRAYAFLNIGLRQKDKPLEYSVQTEVRNYLKANKLFFLPQARLKYNFKKDLHYLEGVYTRKVGFSSINKLNTIGYAESFRNYYLSSLVKKNTELLQNNFALNYLYFNLYHGITLFINSFYTQYGDVITQDNSFLQSVNYATLRRADGGFSWANQISFDFRWSKIKHRLKLEGSYNMIETPFYRDNTLDNSRNTNIRSGFTLSSNFKRRFYDYEIGISYRATKNQTEKFGINTTVNQWVPEINFILNIGEEFTAYLDHSYFMYQSQEFKNNYLNMSYYLTYQKEKSKIKYFINAENFLYINGNDIISTNHTNAYLETQKTRRIPGFIGAGLSFEF